MDKVPLVDASDPGAWEDIYHVFAKGDFVNGWDVAAFEGNWAARVHARSAVAMSSGTDALTLLFRYLKSPPRPPGASVVVPAYSFRASWDSVMHAGLNVIPCDVDDYGLMDPVDLIKVLREHGKNVLAVMPVHLYGQVADVKAIDSIRKGFDVPFLVEDACQAHGAKYPDGTPVGSKFPAAWSFMPAKILGGCGDGGAVTLPGGSEWDEADEWLRAARNHGRSSHTEHSFPGWKARMDTVKAAYLDQKLKRLHDFNRQRTCIAENYYLPAFKDVSYIRTQQASLGRVWSYFAVWTNKIALSPLLLEAHMSKKKVSTGRHYPYILGNQEECPKAFDLSKRTLTLPLWPHMTDSQIERVIDAASSYYVV